MGFAVVADEVRTLAQHCGEAAKETVVKVEGAAARTAEGVAISARVDASLRQILEKARGVDELIADVAKASDEQNKGLDQLNSGVIQMDEVTQSTAAGAEQGASAAAELKAQTVAMKETVGKLMTMIGGRVSAESGGATSAKDAMPNSGLPEVSVPARQPAHAHPRATSDRAALNPASRHYSTHQ